MSRDRLILVSAFVAGIALRAVLAATSLGTVDALLWYRWIELIEREGLLRSYLFSDWMNHPPLALAIMRGINTAGTALGLEIQDALRTADLIADVITTFALVRIARRLGAPQLVTASLFFLSPAAIFITGFHGNTDPMMTMLLAVAFALLIDERQVLAGLVFAAASGIKIAALLTLPLVLIALPSRARLRFAIPCGVAGLAIFLPGLVVSGPTFVKNVFGYASIPTNWGLRLLFAHAGEGSLMPLVRPVMLVALVTLWVVEGRRGGDVKRLPALAGLTFLIVFTFAPGFGIQYFFWPLPFLVLLLGRRAALLMHGIISVYLFWYYTVWSGGFPWWYAEKAVPPAVARPVVNAGLLVWAACAAAAIAGARRLYARPA